MRPIRADFFVSPLLFERKRIRQPFGGRSALSLSVLVSLMRRKRNRISFLSVSTIFLFCTIEVLSSTLYAFYRCLDTSALSSLFFSPFPIFSFSNVIIFFAILFVSFLGNSRCDLSRSISYFLNFLN